MSWSIYITNKASSDFAEIYNYIFYVLKAPQAAERLSDKIIEMIDALSDFPKIYPTAENGIRKMPVDNYLVFYELNESQRIISITRIVYGGTDLSQMNR